MPEVTEGMLRALHGGNPQVLVAFDWSFHQINGTHSYELFVELVEKGVVWSLQQIAQNPKERRDESENGLTSIVVSHLRCMGFQVEFDGSVGGHCDIIVRYGTLYTWIAEAKIHGSYKWLLKGYLQLASRYSTGLVNEDRGGMLIYFKTDNVADKMKVWSDTMAAYKGSGRSGAARRPIAVTDLASPRNSLRSVQSHKRTGADYTVTHFALSIHWDPEV